MSKPLPQQSTFERHWWRTDHQPGRFIYLHQRLFEYDPNFRTGAKAIQHSRWRARLCLCRCWGCIEERFHV
jgi:hypothetical protein